MCHIGHWSGDESCRMLDCMTPRTSPGTLNSELTRSPADDSWLRPAIAVAAVAWGANQFAPLIVLYQRHGVSATATGVMFGLYAVGLVPALIVGGRWSDRAGRHVVLLTALVLSLVASTVLMAGSVWHELLFPGRLAAGLSSGLAFGTGAAWIRELSAKESQPHAGPRRATTAMTIGFGGGPLVAGLIAQYVSRIDPPDRGLPLNELWPYAPQIALGLLALAALRWRRRDAPDIAMPRPTPEQVARESESLSRHLALVSAPFAPWVFGTAAIALAYLPALVANRVGTQPLTFAAAATAIPAFAGLAAQPLAVRLRPRLRISLLAQAMVVVVLALVVALWAASAATVWAVLLAAVGLGAAYGIAQFAGLDDIQRVAAPASLGVATSAYQALSYLGFALPYLLTLSRTGFGWSPATGLSAVLVLAVAALAWLAASDVRQRHSGAVRVARDTVIVSGSRTPCADPTTEGSSTPGAAQVRGGANLRV
jgi:MFS family permease